MHPEAEIEEAVSKAMHESGLTSICVLTGEGAAFWKERTGKAPPLEAWDAIKAAMHRAGVNCLIAVMIDGGIVVDYNRLD